MNKPTLRLLSVTNYGPICEGCGQRIPPGTLVLDSGVYQCAPCVFEHSGPHWSVITGLAAIQLAEGPDAFSWEWTVP